MLLANCDLTRRNELDGRGTLSEEALADFMDGLVQPERLLAKSGTALEAVLCRGELPCGDADVVAAPVNDKAGVSSRPCWRREC
jgi:hypothetical protein